MNRTWGHLANEKGRTNERRVLAAALALEVAWVRGARAATLEEDARGIDVVVSSDVGDLYVQVKSSTNAANAFAEERGAGRIAVVVGTDDERRMRIRLVRALASLRALFIAKRSP